MNKSLDAVISGYEKCAELSCSGCPYLRSEDPKLCDPSDKDDDALYYLKEYQEKLDKICTIAKIMADSWEIRKQTMAFEDKNEPIPWDELATMDGKPVWLERNVCDGFKEWCLVHITFDDEIWFADGNGTIFRYPRDEYGKIWVTYRKERS